MNVAMNSTLKSLRIIDLMHKFQVDSCVAANFKRHLPAFKMHCGGSNCDDGVE